jgi:hypothetical protein
MWGEGSEEREAYGARRRRGGAWRRRRQAWWCHRRGCGYRSPRSPWGRRPGCGGWTGARPWWPADGGRISLGSRWNGGEIGRPCPVPSLPIFGSFFGARLIQKGNGLFTLLVRFAEVGDENAKTSSSSRVPGVCFQFLLFCLVVFERFKNYIILKVRS